MQKDTRFSNVVLWALGILFIVLGFLNAFLVHIIPGIFYIVLSLLYFPPLSVFFRDRVNITIPYLVKVVLALFVLWGTLAVGDLAELYGL